MEKRIRIVKKGQDDGNLKYWLSLSKKKRLSRLEEMRKQINSQQYDTQQGFQRVYNITERK